ncbi:MAG: hypothetical protein CK532_08330, partial [Flavobacteriales bacterium]
DPFSGSGTTGIMARKANRNFIGIDISQDYNEIANQRMEIEVCTSSSSLGQVLNKTK